MSFNVHNVAQKANLRHGSQLDCWPALC